MGEEAILLKVAPLAGGEDNVSFHHLKHGRLYIQLKDQTLLDGPALQELDSVESWELKNGQLVITLSDDKKEVKHMANNKQIAQEVLKAIGGKENVSNVTHCMTRLRLNLKDDGAADRETLKKIDGVLSVVSAPGQLQVVIGNNVDKVL